MKKLITIIVFGLIITSANAQIQSLAGPRFGMVYISASPGSTFLNGDLDLGDVFDGVSNYDEIAKGAVTSLYGWQWESRFADGGNITGIVEWIALVGGMEKGKFLPSVSSMVGARTASGLEFAVGPNFSLTGISMVFGVGYNFKSGNLNIPVNIAFVPGRKGTFSKEAEIQYETEYIITQEYDPGPDGYGGTADDIPEEGYYYETTTIHEQGYEIDYNTGSRFSITVGFNLSK
ncbi:MAG: hypothetical protein VYB55_03330 [Bacteroidota bacterium]|nr:hypothetical protein [Bacteroidota bacterium]